MKKIIISFILCMQFAHASELNCSAKIPDKGFLGRVADGVVSVKISSNGFGLHQFELHQGDVIYPHPNLEYRGYFSQSQKSNSSYEIFDIYHLKQQTDGERVAVLIHKSESNTAQLVLKSGIPGARATRYLLYCSEAFDDGEKCMRECHKPNYASCYVSCYGW